MTPAPSNYRPAQIILHWVVVLGIVFQWIFNEQMARVVEARQTGDALVSGDLTMAWVHASVGMIILLSVLARLFLRMRYGVPAHAPGTSDAQATIATWMHRTLYATLFAMVITGSLTWNEIAPLGTLHFYFNTLLFFLALGHAGAALFNQFVRKDGTMRRMMLSRPK